MGTISFHHSALLGRVPWSWRAAHAKARAEMLQGRARAPAAQTESEIQRRCQFSSLGPDEDSEYNLRLSKDDS